MFLTAEETAQDNGKNNNGIVWKQIII